MTKAAFINKGSEPIERVYGTLRRQRIESMCDLVPGVVGPNDLEQRSKELQDVEVAFSTWGMPALTAEQLDLLPGLKAVFYAAGSVRAFAPAFLDRGIQVFSAWMANAVPVAEFTVAQILLANKGYFHNTETFRADRRPDHAYRGLGNYDVKVSLLGAGAIGRKVIELLQPYSLDLQVFDPFLSEDQAATLDVKKVSLEEAFGTAQVVSNHMANLPETVGMLDGACFERMRDHGVFINTGRGATVKEDELIQILERRPDLFALLDVTNPEPPDPESKLFSLPNCRVSSHIAGSIHHEVGRMADWMLEEFNRWRDHNPVRYEVTPTLLKTMA